MATKTNTPVKQRGRPKLKVSRLEKLGGVESAIQDLKNLVIGFSNDLNEYDQRLGAVKQGRAVVDLFKSGIKKLETAHKNEQKAKVKLALFEEEVDFKN